MTSYIATDLRRVVESRADHCCEYCLIHADDTYLGCQIDHIIAEKHGGLTVEENLAVACVFCNRAKGSDIGSIAASTGEFTRFFNPRTDRWTAHFQLDGSRITARSPIGEATEKILLFNANDRMEERETLIRLGRYGVVSD